MELWVLFAAKDMQVNFHQGPPFKFARPGGFWMARCPRFFPSFLSFLFFGGGGEGEGEGELTHLGRFFFVLFGERTKNKHGVFMDFTFWP